MRFYTASKLGSKRSRSDEGYLVCLDVAIARTGEMIYVATELPELEAGKDGLIRVMREASEVFKPEAMASFVAKPNTNDHPPVMLKLSNSRQYAVGTAVNVRQGNGAQDDLLFADLMFWDPAVIDAIEGGKDEISCGYDADYEFVAPGVYRQINIVGNHVAVVADGRCGERCAIGDSAPPNVAISAQGAGVALRAPSGKVLFLRRSTNSDHPGTWCFPGGKIEPGEALAAAARRELAEEAGLDVDMLQPLDSRGGFVTLMGSAASEAKPTLNDEHTEYAWALPSAPPVPLHPGVAATLRDKGEAIQNSTVSAAPMLDSRSAPPCGCGGHTTTHDAKPAPRNRKTRDMAVQKSAAARRVQKGLMMDRARRAFAAKDEAGFEEAMNAVEESAAESDEQAAQADIIQMVGEAVAAAIAPAIAEAVAPLASRLDDVDAFVTDRKTKDAAELEAEEARKTDAVRAEEEARKKEAEKVAVEAKDNDALAAFLKAKGLSDEDVAEACKLMKGSETTDDSLLGNPEPDGSNDPGTNGTSTFTDPNVAASQGSTGPGTKDDMGGDVPAGGGGSGGSYGGSIGGQGGSAGGTTDSKNLLVSFRDAVAKAEILAPGVKLPSFDSKAASKSTMDAICDVRRRAVKSAFDSADRKAHVIPFLDSATPDFDKMTCAAVKHVFAGAAELAKRANMPVLRTADALPAFDRKVVTASVATMQASADDLWKHAK